MKREKQLKSAKGREFIWKLIKNLKMMIVCRAHIRRLADTNSNVSNIRLPLSPLHLFVNI